MPCTPSQVAALVAGGCSLIASTTAQPLFLNFFEPPLVIFAAQTNTWLFFFPAFQVDCEKLSNLSLSCIPVHCPKLTSFDLKGMCYVTDHGLMPLTRSNHLQSLSLAEADITDCTLESIAKGCGAKVR